MARVLSTEEYICRDCGYLGRATVRLRGNGAVEKILWCLLIIPGFLYARWRRAEGMLLCSGCRVGHIVDIDSPEGGTLLENKLRGGGRRKPIIRKG